MRRGMKRGMKRGIKRVLRKRQKKPLKVISEFASPQQKDCVAKLRCFTIVDGRAKGFPPQFGWVLSLYHLTCKKISSSD
jgi:hypothetical protein